MSNLRIFSGKIPINGKRLLLRVDLNVPIANSEIKDDVRIKTILPFLGELIKKKAKVVIISHLGRPKGKVVPGLSLRPIVEYLKKNLSEKVYFYNEEINEKTVKLTNKLNPGEVLILENIRFFKEEENNDEIFAKQLARLGDVFINEAFSCSHRKQASVHKITKFIESYGGPQLCKEIKSIDLIKKNKKKPVTCIIGGSKISTKINIISSLIENSDNLIIVGAMANNFLHFNGIKIGMSLMEKNVENIIKKINLIAKENNCKIFIPKDYYVSENTDGMPVYRSQHEVKDREMILDLGKNSIKSIGEIIDKSNTVFWNGPAGFFENKNFQEGTLSLASNIAKNTKSKSLISIVGGGDTIAALKNQGFENSFTHLSTAGGALLESLEGKELPAIKALRI